MPIYEFRCPVCETLTSRLCKVGDDGSGEVCRSCGHVDLSRQLSVFASPGTGGQKSGSCTSCSKSACGSCSIK